MKVRLWGTRGSLARSGPETVRYGGDTSSVEVRGDDGSLVILDAGSGILRLGENMGTPPRRIDILLTHLHMDHIQGLGFFTPLYSPEAEVHLWGPTSTTLDLRARLTRYLSPPLFPVRLRDLPAVAVHDLHPGVMAVGPFRITTDVICHPGHTFGFRLEDDTGVLAYMPDHEPALGIESFPGPPEWTSGMSLASEADVLIHDAQYTDGEYSDRIGWGHSTFAQATVFAEMAGVGTLVTFHHDPTHSDRFLDEVADTLYSESVTVVSGMVGAEFTPGS